MIAFNLGLVHLTLDQPASAFHYFSASAHLRPQFASAYGLLGVTLHRLQDVDNAERAFARAVELNR
jgi:Bardet-Biedl syndrome 4 protein